MKSWGNVRVQLQRCRGQANKGGRHLPQKKYPLLTAKAQRERKKKESLRSIEKNLRVPCVHFACTPAPRLLECDKRNCHGQPQEARCLVDVDLPTQGFSGHLSDQALRKCSTADGMGWSLTTSPIHSFWYSVGSTGCEHFRYSRSEGCSRWRRALSYTHAIFCITQEETPKQTADQTPEHKAPR